MANITITERCNLRCPYCFADEFTFSDKRSDITFENFKKAVDFITTKEGERVGIIGGEPTLHANFDEMIQYVLNNPKVRAVTLFTNGIKPECIKKYLSSKKFGCLININSEENMGKEQFSKLMSGLEDIFSDGVYDKAVNFGLNIYRPSLNFKFFADLCKKYKRKELRVSLSIPQGTFENNYDALRLFYYARPSLIELFKELQEVKVIPHFDCNYVPRCIWNSDDQEVINKFYDIAKETGAYCNILDCNTCTQVIDILPNLTAIRCFGMSRDIKANINEFKNLDALKYYFSTNIDSFKYSVPAQEHCKECYSRISQQCMCGCLAFRSKKIKEAREFCMEL